MEIIQTNQKLTFPNNPGKITLNKISEKVSFAKKYLIRFEYHLS